MKKILSILSVSSEELPAMISADVRRRKILETMLVVILIADIALLIALLAIYFLMPEKIRRPDVVTLFISGIGALCGFALMMYLNRHVSSRISGILFLVVLYASFIGSDSLREIAYGRSLIFMLLPVIIASILFPPWGGIITAAINGIAISYVAVLYNLGLPNFPAIMLLFLVAFLIWQSTTIIENALKQIHRSNLSLQNAEEKIRQANAELEQRVTARTIEFQAANTQLQAEMWERKQAQEELLTAKESLRLANLGLQQALAREQEISRTDSLTGVHNRRYFYEFADYELSVAKRYGKPLSMIMFDIDHFKQVNDTHGHQAGDEILKYVASVAQQQIRGTDILARYGGEEFTILLPRITAQESAIVAERIREIIAAYRLDFNGQQLSVTVSLGVAEYDESTTTLDKFVQQADKAMYAAKTAGRNCVIIHPAQT